MSAPNESLLISIQRLLPAKFMGRIVRWLSRSENPWLKNALIKSFTKLYNVDLSDAKNSNPESYASFNAFFTRELREDARHIDDSRGSIVSPADGTLAEFGTLRGSQLIQAKGIHYTIEQLFAGQELAAQRYTNGNFATIYLAPYNYHRIHMPMDGVLTESVYVPGELLSVNEATTNQVQGLYVGNERLIQMFNSDNGPFAVIMVGALNVGSITTVWGGEIQNRVRKHGHHFLHTNNDPHTNLKKGDYLGHFNLGSTVIIVAGPEQMSWASNMQVKDTMRVGERMGQQIAV